MRINELLGGRLEPVKEEVYSLLDGFSIWTSLEEGSMLKKLHTPVRLSSLTEREQVITQGLIRKSVVTKVGTDDPTVVANEKIQ